MQSVAQHDKRVIELAELARKRPPAERESWLSTACQGDNELLRDVLDMVDGEDRMASFLLHPAISFVEFPHPFEPGQIVVERFEIVREIGEGGMGVVYEAFDRKRGLRIAIKAAKPGFHRLLSPELEGALAVRHPNVCRVNEIHTARTAHGEIDFLTMELLEGETLASTMKRRGKFAISEAQVIARQLCFGLAEAHRSGVIHRDLKPANILVCPQQDAPPLAVITDFGLAGSGAPAGEIAGTPRYMAPELWRGESATQSSDIYALGVVLYEMTTCPDLSGVSPIPDPHRMRSLQRRWRNTISRCLAAEPSARPADANQVERQLEPMPRSAKIALTTPLLAVLLAALSLFVPQVRFRVKDTLGLSSDIRLVVLPPQRGNSAALSEGVLQDVSNSILHWRSGTRAISVISPEDAQQASVQTAEQAKNMHATHALETSLRQDGQDLVVSATVIDLSTGAHLRGFSARYTPATLGALPRALTGVVTAALELSGDSHGSLSPAATIAYDRGLHFMEGDRDVAEAIVQFKEAARLDPRSPIPLANLVNAEVELFNQTKDTSLLSQARLHLKAEQDLNPDSVWLHLGSGKLSEAAGQYEEAREDYIRACQLEPRDANTKMYLANIYTKLNMPEEAIAGYQEAIAIDPEYYLPHEFLGYFYYVRGRFAEAAQQFRQATRLAPGLFRDYVNLAGALTYLGRYTEAEQALKTSLNLRETSSGLNNMGDLLTTERKYAESIPYFERAVTLSPSEYLWQLNLGDADRHLGRKEAARAAYHTGIGLALATLEQDPRQGLVRAMVGYFAAQLGERHRAQEEIRQALQLEPNNSRVIFRTVLTYEALGMRSSALATLAGATTQLLDEIKRDPDLAEFSHDLRFKNIEAQKAKEDNKHV